MSSSNDTKLIGCVKWFNNKSGYGFIKILSECDLKDKDIFAHHSSITVSSDLYKYLVQGEYVEFDVEKMENKNHDSQAVKITGILGHKLMCETRHENKDNSKSKDGFSVVSKKK